MASDISQEIYHRIYRLYKKNIDPKVIATTVEIPLKAVQNIVSRFAHTHQPSVARERVGGSYLDILVAPRGRYAVVELTGFITADHRERLEAELAKALVMPFKAFALRMTDALELDEKGIEALLTFAERCRAKSIYVAILDPSPAIEPAICEQELDSKLPVFGTEAVFEKNAFAMVVERHHKK